MLVLSHLLASSLMLKSMSCTTFLAASWGHILRHGRLHSRAFREGMQYLCQAFDADSGQPAVLIMLARLCINRGDPERARSLAIAAHAVAAAPEARAHALMLQGRAEHALSKWQEARQCYQEARLLRRMCCCLRARPGASDAGPVHIQYGLSC